MHYLFRKSLSVIVLNTVMATLIVMGFSNLITAYQMTDYCPDGLSKSYMEYRVHYGVEGKTSALDMIEAIESRSANYVLYRASGNGIYGIAAKGNIPQFDLVSGRNLTTEDFDTHSNVALVSEETAAQCTSHSDKLWFSNMNVLYEVIGVYRMSDNTVIKDAGAVYSLLPNKSSIEGTYRLDAGGQTENTLSAVNDICSLDILHSPTDYSFWGRMKAAMQNQNIPIIVIVLVLLMVALNSVDATANWLDSRRREIYIRRICGGSRSRIHKMLFQNYLAIITPCYCIGTLLASILTGFLSRIDAMQFSLLSFNWITAVFAVIPVLLVGSATLGIMLLMDNRKNLLVETRW